MWHTAAAHCTNNTFSDWTTIPRQGNGFGVVSGLVRGSLRADATSDWISGQRRVWCTFTFAPEKRHSTLLFAFDIFRLVGARIYETRSFSPSAPIRGAVPWQRMLLTLVVISSARRPATRVSLLGGETPSAVLPGPVFVAFTYAQPLRYGRARLLLFSFLP